MDYIISMSDFIFARPSFLEGMARNADLFGTMQIYNTASSPQEADARAIASDWAMVGQDLRTAIGQWEKENIAPKP